MLTRIRQCIQTHPLVAFFLLAYALTWSGSLFYVLTTPGESNGMPSLRGLPGVLVWYYGPCLAALIVTAVTVGKDGLRQLWRRVLLWRVH
jgi:hypothetical protein